MFYSLFLFLAVRGILSPRTCPGGGSGRAEAAPVGDGGHAHHTAPADIWAGAVVPRAHAVDRLQLHGGHDWRPHGASPLLLLARRLPPAPKIRRGGPSLPPLCMRRFGSERCESSGESYSAGSCLIRCLSAMQTSATTEQTTFTHLICRLTCLKLF